MSDETFDSVWVEMREIHERGLRAFALWMSQHWKMSESREEWERSYQDPYPGDEYLKAYNAGVESALGAVDCYVEESGR